MDTAGIVSPAWFDWFFSLARAVNGADGTVTLAKITPGGTDGSLVIQAGRIVTINPPT